MSGLFFYGTLCHPPLLRAVLGRDADVVPANLPGHGVFWVKGHAFPTITEGGGTASGVYFDNPTETDLARLDFYEGGFAYVTRKMTVMTGAGPREALVYFPPEGGGETGEPWQLQDWVERWGDVASAAAQDFMRQMGHVPAEKLRSRYPMMLMRGGARRRAEQDNTAITVRRRQMPGDIPERQVRQVYANYFAVEEYDLRFRRFDGEFSPEVNRAVFIGGDAAVVLPYDPVRDTVLLIEQVRMGPHARGDRQSWLLEAVAGRIDGGETPEAAARREAREEAGLDLRDLIAAGAYYPSPAAMGEYLYTFLGIADLPEGGAGFGGLPGENEDIRVHLLPFDALMEMVASGEANTAPLLLLAYFLAANRARLRAPIGGA
ncbi:MAG: NUDIX domain-containing protein [Rhodobacteraceae bacterium]|nr:NUDIX domain-containing protein [Paracoccaceae bacterium]